LDNIGAVWDICNLISGGEIGYVAYSDNVVAVKHYQKDIFPMKQPASLNKIDTGKHE